MYIYKREKKWNYHAPAIYFITMEAKERRPIFGKLTESGGFVSVEPTALGQIVLDEWENIPTFCPKIKILGKQVMPDHFHGIIQVTETLEQKVGYYLRGYKTGCYKQARRAGLIAETDGKLFERDFFPSRLVGQNQLQTMFDYMKDNPRRLYMKKLHPEYFALQRNVWLGKNKLDLLGNDVLLTKPMLAVHVHSAWTSEEKRRYKNECILAARKGSVLISPFISSDERAVEDEAIKEGLPTILVCPFGFHDLQKPFGKYFEHCAQGKFLMLTNQEYSQNPGPLTRTQCVEMNALAEVIVNENANANENQDKRTI